VTPAVRRRCPTAWCALPARLILLAEAISARSTSTRHDLMVSFVVPAMTEAFGFCPCAQQVGSSSKQAWYSQPGHPIIVEGSGGWLRRHASLRGGLVVEFVLYPFD
jgi:hypothetical protein